MRDDAAELGRVSFHFHESSAKRRLFLMFGQRLLEQTTKTVLLPLDPQKVLNLLACACTRDLRIQKRAAHDLVALQAARSGDALKASHMLVCEPHGESMS